MGDTVDFNHSSHNQDYFEKLFSHDAINTAAIATFFVVSIAGPLLLLGIIWYEKRGRFRYRTVINQLFSTFAWMVVWYILLVYIPVGIRMMTGPLNKTFCDIFPPLKYFLQNCLLLTFDTITMLRYIFIFKMPNFAVINDDFMRRGLVLSIVMLSFWSAAVTQLSPGEHRFIEFVCAGMDPNQNKGTSYYQDQPRKIHTTGIITLGSVILHIIVNTKIFLYEHKERQDIKSIRLGTIKKQNGDRTNNLQQNPQSSCGRTDRC